MHEGPLRYDGVAPPSACAVKSLPRAAGMIGNAPGPHAIVENSFGMMALRDTSWANRTAWAALEPPSNPVTQIRCCGHNATMSIAPFLQVLFERGEVVFRKQPSAMAIRDPEATEVLQREFDRYVLDLPGTAPPFDADVALRAADVLRWACWFSLSREEDPQGIEPRLDLPGRPTKPSEHFSADLSLRFLVRVHARARALQPGDVLVQAIESTLRRWPLSGVLCDIADAPYGLDFGVHEGLMLFYAQRFATHPRPGWEPTGKAAEYLELVRREKAQAVKQP